MAPPQLDRPFHHILALPLTRRFFVMGQEYRPTPLAASLTRPILLLLWAALSLSLLWYVVRYGHNQPWADEWEFVPTLTGNEPVGPFFLHPHNEHRLPLPRVIYIALWEATHDFRAGMVFQVAVLSAIAYRAMRLAAWLRGVPHWADAFFPVSLLHIGHCENLLMGYQLCFVLASALVCGALELALRLTPVNSARTAMLAAPAGLALALSGGFGIVLAAPVLCWVVLLIAQERTGGANRTAVAALFLFATVAYCGYYFASYQRPPAHPPFEPKNWEASLEVAGEFLGISFGIGVGPVWSISLLLLLGALAWVAIARMRTPDARLRTPGIAAGGAGVILLSLAVGAGRGGFGSEMGLWPRYSVLGWPLLAAIALAAISCGGTISRRLPPLLLVVALLAFVPNTRYGLEYAEIHDAWLSDIERQLREGESTDFIIGNSLAGSGQAERARRGLPMLRAAKIGPFAGWEPR